MPHLGVEEVFYVRVLLCVHRRASLLLGSDHWHCRKLLRSGEQGRNRVLGTGFLRGHHQLLRHDGIVPFHAGGELVSQSQESQLELMQGMGVWWQIFNYGLLERLQIDLILHAA